MKEESHAFKNPFFYGFRVLPDPSLGPVRPLLHVLLFRKIFPVLSKSAAVVLFALYHDVRRPRRPFLESRAALKVWAQRMKVWFRAALVMGPSLSPAGLGSTFWEGPRLDLGSGSTFEKGPKIGSFWVLHVLKILRLIIIKAQARLFQKGLSSGPARDQARARIVRLDPSLGSTD